MADFHAATVWDSAATRQAGVSFLQFTHTQLRFFSVFISPYNVTADGRFLVLLQEMRASFRVRRRLRIVSCVKWYADFTKPFFSPRMSHGFAVQAKKLLHLQPQKKDTWGLPYGSSHEIRVLVTEVCWHGQRIVYWKRSVENGCKI